MGACETGIRAEVWSAFGIPFSRVEYTQHEFAPHFHDHFVIMNVRSGINLGLKQRKPYAVDRSHLLVLEPGALHTGSSWGGRRLVYEAMYPDARALGTLAERFQIQSVQSNSDLTFDTHVFDNPNLVESFNRLFGSISDHADPLDADSRLCEFVTLLTAKSVDGKPEKGSRDSMVIRKAMDFIDDHYSDNEISLGQIGQAAGISPHYLVRQFKRYIGQTPFEFLRNLRVERSKELMRKNQSLTEIALATGFYDQSHFIRSFRAVTGWSPGLYRKALR